MYYDLAQINARPRPWEFHTSDVLWTDTHIAEQMMLYHLNETVNAASRNHALIRDSVTWMTDRFSIGEDTYIADFGCGPGLYTLPLVRTGAKVTGIDFSENSLRYAREQASELGLEINYTVQTRFKSRWNTVLCEGKLRVQRVLLTVASIRERGL
jgi:2-polyprenyl-3-methyl-5-hydroxy-6-metoxy-1,4-benzoquinol methylase